MTEDNKDLSFHEERESYGSVPKKRGELKIYTSREEMEEDRYSEMAKRTGLENLINLRRLINISYGMHGYDPNKSSGPHNITFPDRERF